MKTVGSAKARVIPARVDVARALPSGATDIEPARAFFQDRLRLWAFWVFVLSFGFYLTNTATWPLVRGTWAGVTRMMIETSSLHHLAASSVFGGVWVLTRGLRLSIPALRFLDLATLIAGCTVFALMGASTTQLQRAGRVDAMVAAYSGLLACACTVLARAITVPSTPRRTLMASIVAMAPVILAARWATASGAAAVNVATWCAVTTAIATIGSRVIFGLRTEAARARRLGQYTLETRIGAGGMGVVYRATHAMLRRPTAIKLLPLDRAGEASLERFEREVQMTAQLSHPNTVAIYDYGRTPDGIFYYAMEYLDGINLEDLVRVEGPQPPGRVVAILEQVCGALAEAHGRGLVHRDIKPANIILTERGGDPDVAKVVDFGLVKPLDPDVPELTTSGSTVLAGTPLYMSPEAMTMPDAADPRSDLYALGAVAYFLLTGHPVFEAATVVEIIGHHLHTEPVAPSRRVRHSIPADLDALVLQCLRKDPVERPESARALRDALRACTMVQPWTSDAAAAWWRTFRSRATARTALSGDSDHELTMTVDAAVPLPQFAG